MHDRRRWVLGGLAVLCAAAAALPPTAGAADKLLWGNNNATSISFANLDGSGSGDILNTAVEPAGLAVDSATGRLYFTNEGSNTISFVNLDGSVGALNTTGATVQAPDGLAIDPTTRRIYWANDTNPGAISFASLEGSGGGDLNTTGATVHGPSGVTVDLPSGRLYWANYNGPEISFANLNDSGGGGDVNTSGASMDGPAGLAVDPNSRKIYWADDANGAVISFARLDESGAADLETTGATVHGPWGVAIDPEAGRIYWANNGGESLAFAKLDGSGGGGALATPGATVSGPDFPIILKTPVGTGAPAIGGGSTVGTTLSCSQGSWAADLVGALLYRAPNTFAFQWSVDGREIAGATSAAITAAAAGQYTCRVTGTNRAGSSAQASAPHRVGPPVPPDFDTAILENNSLYLRLKCPSRFKPECVGNAAALTATEHCTFRHGRRHCKHGLPITTSVSAKQKPKAWKVAVLEVTPKYRARVAEMAKRPDKKLLIVRQLIHSKRFKKGSPQSVFHIYRVRTAAG